MNPLCADAEIGKKPMTLEQEKQYGSGIFRFIGAVGYLHDLQA